MGKLKEFYYTIGLIHIVMFLGGAIIRLDNIKYPNLLMLISKYIWIFWIIRFLIGS